jgi:hypothetical protein
VVGALLCQGLLPTTADRPVLWRLTCDAPLGTHVHVCFFLGGPDREHALAEDFAGQDAAGVQDG